MVVGGWVSRCSSWRVARYTTRRTLPRYGASRAAPAASSTGRRPARRMPATTCATAGPVGASKRAAGTPHIPRTIWVNLSAVSGSTMTTAARGPMDPQS